MNPGKGKIALVATWILVRSRRSPSVICHHFLFVPLRGGAYLPLSGVQRLLCSQSFGWRRRWRRLPSFQAFSPLLSWPAPLLFDAADRSAFVCSSSSPRLCQIKGQRLGGEATLGFILVQPRERSNKSRGNVVTREAERSLPTGRAKWREAPSLKPPLLHSFPAKCHFPKRVR